MSKFIQIAVDSWPEGSKLYALDDEGSIWERDSKGSMILTHRSVTEPKPARAKKEKGGAPTMDEWLPSLRSNPAYAHINFDQEFGKMKAWLDMNKGRKLTKRFVLNWLNKIEAPITIEEFNVCQRRVRKEGFSFMKPCGKPATEKYKASDLLIVKCCKDCYAELMGGRK